MASNSLVYSNARVKSLENGFLSQDKINRMVFAASLEEAVRVLLESGYGAGTIADAYDFETILSAEDKKVSEFMAESTVPKMGLETFLMKNDYHNAKAFVKAKYMHSNEDISYMLAPKGLVDVDELKAMIFNDNYQSLSPIMAEALSSIDSKRALGDKSPRTIDVTLDKAMYKDICKVLKSAKAPSMVKYHQANIDFSNISNFIRYKNIGFDQKAYENDFIEGGDISYDTFKALYDQPIDTLLEKLRYTKYSQVTETINPKDLVPFETAWDNYLIGIFKQDRNDVFSVAPLAGYYVAKKIEIKVVRMILILIKNKIDVNIIKQRLRDYYA